MLSDPTVVYALVQFALVSRLLLLRRIIPPVAISTVRMLAFDSVVSVVQKRLAGASKRRAGTGVRPQTRPVPPDEIRQTLAYSRNCFIAFDVQNR